MNLVVRGFKELGASLSQDKIKAPVFRAVRNSATAVMIAAKNTAPVGATSDLKRSVTMKLDQQRLRATVGFDRPGNLYARYVEEGTGPHWAPISALRRWATQRGLNPWAVQASIAKKGTKAHPFFIPAFERNISYIKSQFSKALEDIKDSIRAK